MTAFKASAAVADVVASWAVLTGLAGCVLQQVMQAGGASGSSPPNEACSFADPKLELP
jgi:hypothetical protein